ncbi:mechanosensitive ion channel [Oscillatoria sp. CS-180]|uniref:mechanosensitive ion channel family protein n=1 Tax=Oscillatoria sp. CS-180 TaxID=3021720 RepID=UPI00232B5056|nr:mechanosensitive ion channel domain-containing protein [Oscillatoria sp. CS-180]MDB9527488.1 mechanosensitive ion channel [Oscillatoria sp. CS-180]
MMWDAYLSLAVENPALFWAIFAVTSGGTALLISQAVPLFTQLLLKRFFQDDTKQFYSRVVEPHRSLLTLTGALGILDLVALILLQGLWYVPWYRNLEFGLTLALTLSLGLFLSQCFQTYFDEYLLGAAVEEGRKTNSELLVVSRFLANLGLIFILTTLFAQTHQINIIGVFASLGVGGIAIAFSAQKVLEQLLGGVVLYVDRPFEIDDYIGLPDGTFGRVETIGLRSTKIRTSGKGTLAIVPNSSLIQTTVENFTGAKKVMAIVYLNLYRAVGEEEQALIRQVITESTRDIFGIDTRSTDITFRTLDSGNLTQVQATLFILGATGSSMDIRRQLLDIANQKMTQRLKSYGISFDIEEPIVYVDSPITI